MTVRPNEIAGRRDVFRRATNVYLVSAIPALVAGIVGYRLLPPPIVEGANEMTAALEGAAFHVYVILPIGIVLALGAVGATVLACVDVMHNHAVEESSARQPGKPPADQDRGNRSVP